MTKELREGYGKLSWMKRMDDVGDCGYCEWKWMMRMMVG
jgi:hypothetical protein